MNTEESTMKPTMMVMMSSLISANGFCVFVIKVPTKLLTVLRKCKFCHPFSGISSRILNSHELPQHVIKTPKTVRRKSQQEPDKRVCVWSSGSIFFWRSFSDHFFKKSIVCSKPQRGGSKTSLHFRPNRHPILYFLHKIRRR
jgi:hypothetical protein